MDLEKVDKIFELGAKKRDLSLLLRFINRDNVSLKVIQKISDQVSDMDCINTCTAKSYLDKLLKRFVAMVIADITKIENEISEL